MKTRLAALLLACLAASAGAAVPQYLNYQGKLGNASGSPLTGTYSFQFKIWDSLSGGTELFSEDWIGSNAQSVTNGIYTVQIGSLTAIPQSVFDGGAAYLEVLVNEGTNLTGAETLSPRERLAASAFAIHSLTSEKLGTGVNIATFTSAGLMLFPGNVGIGTTNPGSRLDIGGSAAEIRLGQSFSRLASIDGAGAFGGGYNFNWNNSAPQHDSLGVMAGYAYDSVGAIRFFTNSSQAAGTAATERVRINAAGNIGIQTTTPATKLHMSSGTLTIDGTAGAINVAVGSVTASAFFGDGSHLTGVTASGSLPTTGGTLTGQLTISQSTLTVTGNAFSVGGSTFVVQTGNVGIGTSSPSQLLEVNGGAGGTSLAQFKTVSGTLGARVGFLDGYGAVVGATSGNVLYHQGDGHYFVSPSLGTEWMRIVNSGNVGIGTASPATKMHMSSGTLTIDGTAGAINVIGGSVTASTFNTVGSAYQVDGFTFMNGGANLRASSGTFLASLTVGSTLTLNGQDASGYSLKLSSGISMPAGTISAALLVGNGLGITNISAASLVGNLPAASQTGVLKTGDTMTGTLTMNTAATALTATGNVGIGNTDPGALLNVGGNSFAGVGTMVVQKTYTNSDNNAIYLEPNKTTNASSTHYNKGVHAYTNTNVSNAVTDSGYFYGLFSEALRENAGDAGTLAIHAALGLQIGHYENTTTAKVTNNAYGIKLDPYNRAGTITNFYDIFLGNMATGGTTTNYYGIYQQDTAAENYFAGNVGIGTTAPATKLHMSSGTLMVDGNASMAFKVGVSSFAINSEGKVGIGTTSPGTLLDVYSSDNATAGSQTTHAVNIRQGSAPLSLGADASFAYIQSWNSKPLQINNQGNHVILNLTGGNVGIGITPTSKLHVSGDANITGTLTAGSLSGTTTGNVAKTGDTMTGTLTMNTAATALTTTGNVGIGTTGPGYPLDVQSSGIYQINMRGTATGSGGYTVLRLTEADTSAVGYVGVGGTTAGNAGFQNSAIFGTQNAYAAKILTNDTVRLTVNSGGNVGIGTTVPVARLEVSSASAVAADKVFIVSSGTAVSQQMFVVKGDGNVGIGTTSPGSLLQVGGSAAAGVTTPTAIQLDNTYHTTSDFSKLKMYLFRNDAGSEWYGFGLGGSGDIYYRAGNNSNGMHRFVTSNLERMTIIANGNVGIGTSTPGKLFEVNGAIYNRGILYQKTSDGQGSGAHGISFYDPAFYTWFDYMAPPASPNSPSGTAAASDSTSGVTSWARRFNIENNAGYGWIFESGPNTSGQAPTVKFSINSNNGNFHATGQGVIDGNVGIGTSSPVSALHVYSASGAGGPQYALIVATGAAASQYVVTVTTNGVLYAARGMSYGGDLAEMYAAKDDSGPGDIVMLAEPAVAVTKAVAGKGVVLGVVSTWPGMTLGAGDMGRDGTRVPVALSGRVPVKVSLENGPVRAGMALAASSTPGRAARALHSGQIIGIALEDSAGAGSQASVLCFVKPQYWVEPADYESLRGEVSKIKAQIMALTRER